MSDSIPRNAANIPRAVVNTRGAYCFFTDLQHSRSCCYDNVIAEGNNNLETATALCIHRTLTHRPSFPLLPLNPESPIHF